MKLSAIQKIGMVFFACTLVPAYLVANWRYESNFSVISEKLEREEELLQSAQKLLSNCAQNESKSNDHYDANYQVCANGEQISERTTLNINTFTQERLDLHTRWWRNFLLTTFCLNMLGLLVYQSRRLLVDQKSV
jgi:hypothetical protein